MVAQAQAKTYTIDEYFELELVAQTRSEYRNGVIVPMTGGTPIHNRVSGNLYIALSIGLRRQAFEVFHVDQRLWIPDVSLHTYPDVMVVPKPLELKLGRKDTVVNPCFIAEVLSKSTRNYDRSEKFAAYRSIPTFEEYLLIDQDRVHVEHHVKTAAHQWLMSEYNDASVVLSLRSSALEVTIEDLYENVSFESD
jgi:Uma2 family endonuclease